MYESRRDPPVSRGLFLRRLALHGIAALMLLGLSLLAGMAGYAWLEGLDWTDSFLNAAMLLGGMGPVWNPRTSAGKIFAGVYALYAGIVFLASAAIILAPVVHRLLHRFHWE
jgi:hypothetical protein